MNQRAESSVVLTLYTFPLSDNGSSLSIEFVVRSASGQETVGIVALIKAGWSGSGLSPRDSLLAGMLMEGTATWLSVEARLFPELDQILHDPQQLKASFDRVGLALEKAASDTPDKGMDLFQQDKWGYYVGCWMIQQIEGKFGRETWLELLQMRLEDATQEMIRLYLLTGPPPEYRF